jgi:hypothetical protein
MVETAPQSLDPDPSVILSLINKVFRGRWPEDPDQFNAYFATIGCTPRPLFEHLDDLPNSSRGSLLMAGVSMDNGSWTAPAGKLHFLGFFFYPGTQASRVLAGLASDVVRAGLTDAYGKATDESDQGEGNRTALREVNETSIELYAHVDLAPILQLGLSNREHDKLLIDKRGH